MTVIFSPYNNQMLYISHRSLASARETCLDTYMFKALLLKCCNLWWYTVNYTWKSKLKHVLSQVICKSIFHTVCSSLFHVLVMSRSLSVLSKISCITVTTQKHVTFSAHIIYLDYCVNLHLANWKSEDKRWVLYCLFSYCTILLQNC